MAYSDAACGEGRGYFIWKTIFIPVPEGSQAVSPKMFANIDRGIINLIRLTKVGLLVTKLSLIVQNEVSSSLVISVLDIVRS